jgi:hypothetical protein
MSLITFVCASPSASWSPTQNPNYGSGRVRRKHQPVDMSDDVDVYSYDHGESGGANLEWKSMKTANLDNLTAFFTTIAGPAKAFTYTDPDGAAHTARLIGGLSHRNTQSNRHEVRLELEIP